MTGSVDAIDRIRRLDREPDFSRYDLVLAVIPLAFLLGLVADGALALSTTDAMAPAATIGGLAVVDALFVNPPTGSDAE